MMITGTEMDALTVDQLVEQAERDENGDLVSFTVTSNSRPHHVQPMRTSDGSLVPAYAAFGSDSGAPVGYCTACGQDGELPALLAIVSNGFGCHGYRVGRD